MRQKICWKIEEKFFEEFSNAFYNMTNVVFLSRFVLNLQAKAPEMKELEPNK